MQFSYFLQAHSSADDTLASFGRNPRKHLGQKNVDTFEIEGFSGLECDLDVPIEVIELAGYVASSLELKVNIKVQPS